MEKVKFTKTEVAKMVGVNPKSLSRWTDEKISEELKKSCYKVVEIKKEGRATYYYCKYEEYSMSNEEYLKGEFNVMDIGLFKSYSNAKFKHIEEESAKTRSEVCRESNTNLETSKQWDRKLIDKGVINKDGFLYIATCKKSGQRSITTKETYNQFWRRNRYLAEQKKRYTEDLGKKLITPDDYVAYMENLKNITEGDYYFTKHTKFSIQYDNVLYKLIKESI